MKKLSDFFKKYGMGIILIMTFLLWFRTCGIVTTMNSDKKAILKAQQATDSSIQKLSDKTLGEKDMQLLNNDLMKEYNKLIFDIINNKLTSDELNTRLNSIEQEIKNKDKEKTVANNNNN